MLQSTVRVLYVFEPLVNFLMLQILLFTVVAVGLYFTADWAVRLVEERRGEPLPNRGVIFFGIIFVLAIVSFEVIQRILQGGPLV